MIGIYKITNKINDKFYIGQSNDIERRFKEHCSPRRYLTSHIPVEAAIAKYGKENFEFSVIEECSLDKLNEREAYWIAKLDAIKLGYNCNAGGDMQCRGEENPNAKLTRTDVERIRIIYNNRSMTCKELYKEYKDKISWCSFQAIWRGGVWADVMPEVFTKENKEYYAKYASIKITSTFTDDEVMTLRKAYVNQSANKLYPPYRDRVAYQTFQAMLCGQTFAYLPYYHKKTKSWIQPGEKPKSNPNRQKRHVNSKTIYTDEQIMRYRQIYINHTGVEVYNLSDKKMSQETFIKMLSGRIYTHLPVYSKKQQKWVYKKAVSTIPESGE